MHPIYGNYFGDGNLDCGDDCMSEYIFQNSVIVSKLNKRTHKMSEFIVCKLYLNEDFDIYLKVCMYI